MFDMYDFEMKKQEQELKERILKEEIHRTIKAESMDAIGKQRLDELNRLAKQREDVRMREKALEEQVKQMQNDLLQ